MPRLLLRPTAQPDPHYWELLVLLRGDGADALLPVLRAALTQAGAAGLRRRGGPVFFTLTRFDVSSGTTRDRVRDHLARADGAHGALVELVTPCHAPSFELAELFGNLACNLVKFDRAIHDDGARTKREVDDEADAARAAARAALSRVRVTHEAIVRGPSGERDSGETGHSIPLEGRTGVIAFDGDLSAALPWLALGELHGLGGHTAFGMGSVRLWWR